ncbi:MAG TPA: hypothetical protein VJ501_11440, partial [Burkholderiaceae bacterium]|nr:hypothetical protein [Burkholderiaceae bacterium]
AVLHHTRDLRSACAEYFRVLKPGGCLLALREHVISRPEDLTAFFEVHPLHRYYGGENAYTLDRYVQALVDPGFALSRVLAPLDSAINFAPHSQATLIDEIAGRVGQRVPGAGGLVGRLLRLRPIWAIARTALRPVDHRPGRLYSFIAHRPA